MSIRPFTLQECKIQADIILKSIRNNSKDDINQFRTLALFTEVDDLTICKEAKLKHALLLVAYKYGFDNWHALKAYFEITSKTVFTTYSAFLNQWFTNYKEAKEYLHAKPHHFLLPYKNQFFICESGLIASLGFDPLDPDWNLIQHNWVEPVDYHAWARLNEYYIKLKGVNHG